MFRGVLYRNKGLLLLAKTLRTIDLLGHNGLQLKLEFISTPAKK
jgi:hypothetical protein